MKQRAIFHLWLSFIGLVWLTSAASAQSSLFYTDAATGRTIQFTPFGTLVFQQQNLVSGAWRINYEDRSGTHSVWFFNQQQTSGVQAVSLTANLPSGQTLRPGVRLYVRAVMRSADGKLRLTQRFFWDVGRGPISSVLTVENTSNSSLDVNNVIVWRPQEPPPVSSELCPYIPPTDGASIATTLVSIGGQPYIRTVSSFTTPLQPAQAQDVPQAGCHGGRDEPPPDPS
ncbi:MAG: hypothetical protein U0Y68_22690 [Blastocatellia bacterium]